MLKHRSENLLTEKNMEILEAKTFLDDVINGLSLTQKQLSPKYFYDEFGAEIFERICTTPEYYPTRTETMILKNNVAEIAQRIGPNAALIEYGSGALEKVKIILGALENPNALVPLDISKEQLNVAAKKIKTEFPHLNVLPLTGDFTKLVKLPKELLNAEKKVAFFPGSTIGNFEKEGAIDFLKSVRATVGENGLMLIGVDLQKDRETILKAYNDEAGVTAEFNKNILMRINRELDGNFNLNDFKHIATYNEEHHRVEMHLRSLTVQTVCISGVNFHFDLHETIHTENCYKYTHESFSRLVEAAGFLAADTWTDSEGLFTVVLLTSKFRQ